MIVGIFGYKGHGKDEVGAVFAEAGYRRESFAGPLKTMLMAGLGLSEAQVFGDLREVVDRRYGVTPRHMMQTLGTEWGRNCISPRLWLEALCARVEAQPDANFVVTDVRFLNEAQTVRDVLYGRLVFVDRPGAPIDLSHPSEQGVDDILRRCSHFTIRNDGSLDDLRRQATHYIETYT